MLANCNFGASSRSILVGLQVQTKNEVADTANLQHPHIVILSIGLGNNQNYNAKCGGKPAPAV